MADHRELRELAQTLRRIRKQHKSQLGRVDDTRVLLEKRNERLLELESRMAELERRYNELHGHQRERVGGTARARRPALLIVNPHSGITEKGSEQLQALLERLRAHGIEADVGMRKSARGTRRLAKDAAASGRDLVIVVGGDGTIEDVASQLVGSRTTLGIMPVGTMNNIARSLGVPLLLDDACALIGMGVTREIDVGRVVAHSEPELEYFLETAGVGLSAIAIPAGDTAKSGRWAAIPEALRKLFSAKPGRMRIELDERETLDSTTLLVTVSNAPLIGNNILVAPDAKLDDGLLDVALYEGMNKAELLAHFLSASNGTRTDNPKVRFHRARVVRIWSSKPVAVHSDKDALGARAAVEIRVAPTCVSMIVGKGIGLTLPVESAPSKPPLTGPQSK